MTPEDDVVGALVKSEMSRKSKKRKEKINDMVPERDYTEGALSDSANALSFNKTEKRKRKRQVESNHNESHATEVYLEKSEMSRKSKKRKEKINDMVPARDYAEGALSDSAIAVSFKKTEKRKKKRQVESNDNESPATEVYVDDRGYVNSTLSKMHEHSRKHEQTAGTMTDGCSVGEAEKVKLKKKKKKEKREGDDLGSVGKRAIENDVSVDNADYLNSTATMMHENNKKGVETITGGCTEGKTEKVKRNKKKNKKVNREDELRSADGAEGITDLGVNETPVSGKQLNNSSQVQKLKSSKKKVSFSSEVEIFPESNLPESREGQSEEVELVRGKRFSKTEDEIVKEAVYDYIEMHGLGEEGLNMVLNSRSHPEVKNCWKEIGAAIPYRPYTAVYYRAQILFRRDENHKWTKEEKDLILAHQKLNGNEWKQLAEQLGTHRFHVKDTWRRINLPNMKKGHWSQEEYQNLFDLVNTDLQLRISEEKKSKHGMLRDNICWTAVSDKLSTRTGPICCMKWYNQLSSPMVAEGIWSDTDDFRLIDALYNMDATCIENVDWDNLLDHRPGEICLKRWKQMVLHVGNNGNKTFSEQVEVLAKRYCPSLIEAREAWDSKPVIP